MNYLLIVLGSFLVAVITTPLTILLAKKFGLVDNPKRSHPAILHKKPIPRGGGIPTFLAIFLTTLLFTPLDQHLVGIFIGGLILVLVGVLDDKYDLNPYLRLIANFLAALVVVASGIGITWITNPFGGQIRFDQIILPFNFFGMHQLVLFADLFALVWIVWVMNALNWSSGVDGQLSGIVVVSTFIMGMVALKYVNSDPTQTPVAVLSFSVMGAYLGFLLFSFYPQKIMPGYGGSTLAGFLLAVLAILAGGKLATALLVLTVPLVDAFWAIIRRLLSRKSPVWGDRDHLHHHLLDLGFSIPQISLFYIFVCAIFGTVSLLLDSQSKLFALALVATGIFGLLITVSLVLRKRDANSKIPHH